MLLGDLAAVLRTTPEELQLEQSFFAQGGDSLSAIHFMSKCRTAGFEMDITDILEAKNLSELMATVASKYNADAIRMASAGRPTNSDSDTASTMSRISSTEASTYMAGSGLLDAADSAGRNTESISPCSSMQNRILISQAVSPSAYQCVFVIKAQTRTPGSLTATRLADLWRQVVARHPTLRTSFVESEHRPSTFDQVVWSSVEPRVTILEDESQINPEQMTLPDSGTTVPHHMYIHSASPVEATLCLSISHALVDGQSAAILLRDLHAAYEGRLQTDKSMPYSEFVRLEDQDLEGAADFWGKYLEGAEETYLEGAFGNKPKENLTCIHETVQVPADVSRSFCGQYGVTMVNVCQVAWGMVLRYFAMKEDVAFSYVTSGRQTELAGLHDAVGLFIHSLVLRVDFTTNPLVTDLLAAATDDVFRSMSHDNVPLLQDKTSKLPTAQKWGNSILSFGKVWQPNSSSKDGLSLSLKRRISPTDVSSNRIFSSFISHPAALTIHVHRRSTTTLSTSTLVREASTSITTSGRQRQAYPMRRRCFAALYEASSSCWRTQAREWAISMPSATRMASG